MLRYFIFLSTLSVAFVSGSVQDYFKIPEKKEGNHSMRNIDFIYTLNLDQRPEKFAKCTEQLNPYGIYPFRFSAVNGWELSLETINNVGLVYETSMDNSGWGTSYLPDGDGKPFHDIVHIPGRTYFCHCMGKGTIGIVLSHLSILQDAVDSGYQTIWVMEDDIQVIQNPHMISDLIDKLDALVDSKWDILFTDQDTKDKNGNYVSCYSYAWRPNFVPENPLRFTKREDVSPEFRKISARYGAYSMIVRRSGMKKILKFIKEHKIFLPYDMDFYLPPKIKIYTVREDVVSTLPNALSDNGAPNYQK